MTIRVSSRTVPASAAPRGLARLAAVLAAALLCATAYLAAAPAQAHAVTEGPFEVTLTDGGLGESPTAGVDFEFTDDTLTIKSERALTVKNSGAGASSASIVVSPGEGKTAYVTLAGVNINTSVTVSAALSVASGSLELALADGTENVLQSAEGYAGLQSNGRSLVIKGTGSLEATGGSRAAGIGGGDGGSASHITIKGGTVTATGGIYGAGIGSGYDGDASDITIEGGTVTATGGRFGAGIGSGIGGDLSGISIWGGTVNATGGLYSAGIGGGYSGHDIAGFHGSYGGNASNITIKGGIVTAKGGDYNGAGIGGGRDGGASDITISGGYVNATATNTANAIATGTNITGGYFAWGETTWMAGNGIGSVCGFVPSGGYFVVENGDEQTREAYPYRVLYYVTSPFDVEAVDDGEVTWAWDSSSHLLTVSGEGAVSIRNRDESPVAYANIVVDPGEGKTAHVTLAGVNIVLGGPALQINSGSLELTLADGTKNVLRGGLYSAGLQNNGHSLVIKGGEEGTGSLEATGGERAAGIGGGGSGAGSNITITGGTVNATGGDYGAGIGGGEKGSASNIAIEGGIVTAKGGKNGAGIGWGSGGSQPSNIVISGGYVNATADNPADAIASGTEDAPTRITGGCFAWGKTTWMAEDGIGNVCGFVPSGDYFVVENDDEQTRDAYPYRVLYYDTSPFVVKAVDYSEVTWDSSSRLLTVSGEGAVSIRNRDESQAADAGIAVNPSDGKTAYVTLAGVNIASGGPALQINSGSLELTLADGAENVLRGGRYSAGLQNNGHSLVIKGTGSLEVAGGQQAAGIGGGHEGDASNITITGGTVTATGGVRAAGIGGGDKGSASNITIEGGTVTATSGQQAAGIGGGGSGDASNITITGGTVTATGGVQAAGIGGGDGGSASNITITGGAVTATGGQQAAGIGGGGHGGSALNITIEGGAVTATSSLQAAGIGGGYEGSASNITIEGGAVTATGGMDGAGIGGGAWGGGASDITIKGGTVTATGGQYGAGIGGGYKGSASNITIKGGIVTAKGGARNGAGIGGGINGGASGITIEGGYVYATADNPLHAIATDAKITGGVFADNAYQLAGADGPGKVYNIVPQDGYGVYAYEPAEGDPEGAWTCQVLDARHEATLAFKDDLSGLTYDGAPLAASDVLDKAAYGDEDAFDKVTFNYVSTDAGEGAQSVAGLPTNAGTYRVTAALPAYADASGTNYGEATVSADVTIAPAPLTATASASATFGDEPASISYDVAIDGWANDEGERLAGFVSDALDISCDYERGSGVGEYSIELLWQDGAAPAALSNYEVTLASGALDVAPLKLTDEVAASMFKPIGVQGWTGSQVEPVVEVSDAWASLVVEETDYMVSYGVNTDPGTGTVTITALSGNLSGRAELSFAISKKEEGGGLGLILPDLIAYDTLVYGKSTEVNVLAVGIDFNEGDAVTLLLNDEEIGGVKLDAEGSGEGTFDTTNDAVRLALRLGTNVVSARYETNDGTIVYATEPTSFVLAPKPVEVVASGTSKTYDGTVTAPANFALALAQGDVLGDDEVDVAFASATFDSAQAGERTITAEGIKLTGKEAGWYTLSDGTSQQFDGEITKLALTEDMFQPIAEQSWTGLQITPDVAVADSWAALLTSDDFTVSYGANKEVGAGAGTAMVTATDEGNFSGSVSLTFDIENAPSTLALEANADGVTYGEKATFTVTPSIAQANTRARSVPTITLEAAPTNGGAAVELATVTEGVEPGQPTQIEFDTISKQLAPGNYVVKARYTGGSMTDAESNAISFTVEAKELSASFADGTSISKTYDASAEVAGPFELKVEGALEGDSVGAAAAFASFADAAAGEGKALTASHDAVTLTGDHSAFYVLDTTRPIVGTGTIKPAPLTVAVAGNVTFGDNPSAIAYSATSSDWQGTDAETLGAKLASMLDFSTDYRRGTSVAQGAAVKATWKGGTQPAALANYEATIIDGAMTITPRELTPEMFNFISDQVWNGEPVTPGVTVSDTWADLLTPNDFTVTYANNNAAPGVGTATVTSQSVNFTGTVELKFAIVDSQSLLQLDLSSQEVVYGDALTAKVVLSEGDGEEVILWLNDFNLGTVQLDEEGAASFAIDLANPEVRDALDGYTGFNLVTAQYKPAEGEDNMYAFSFFAVAPKTVSVGASGASKVYDGTAAAPGGFALSLDGVLAGDEVSVTYASAAFDGKDAGDRALNVSGITLQGADALWYRLEASSLSVAGGIAPATPQQGKVVYTGEAVEGAAVGSLTLSGAFSDAATGAPVPGTLSWDDPAAVLAEGENALSWTFTPADSNYKPVAGTMTVVAKAKPGEGEGGDNSGGGQGGSEGGEAPDGGAGAGDAAKAVPLARTGDGGAAFACVACAALAALAAAGAARRLRRR